MLSIRTISLSQLLWLLLRFHFVNKLWSSLNGDFVLFNLLSVGFIVDWLGFYNMDSFLSLFAEEVAIENRLRTHFSWLGLSSFTLSMTIVSLRLF